jgi:hypothetical protein
MATPYPDNFFGLLVSLPDGVPADRSTQAIVYLCGQNGIRRPLEISLDDPDADDPTHRPEIRDGNLPLNLVFRSNGGVGVPTLPPSDLVVWGDNLAAYLDDYGDLCAVLDIENEFTNLHFTDPTYTLDIYTDQVMPRAREVVDAWNLANSGSVLLADSGLVWLRTLSAAVNYLWNNGARDRALEVIRETADVFGRTIRTQPDLESYLAEAADAIAEVDAYYAALQSIVDIWALHHYGGKYALLAMVEYLRVNYPGPDILLNELGLRKQPNGQCEGNYDMFASAIVAAWVSGLVGCIVFGNESGDACSIFQPGYPGNTARAPRLRNSGRIYRCLCQTLPANV